jgi:hypothetical protein
MFARRGRAPLRVGAGAQRGRQLRRFVSPEAGLHLAAAAREGPEAEAMGYDARRPVSKRTRLAQDRWTRRKTLATTRM